MRFKNGCPDQLPSDEMGFEEWLREHPDYGGEDGFTRLGSLRSTTGEFQFELFAYDYGLGPDFRALYSRATKASDGVTVAVLDGSLLKRSRHGGLFGICDDASQELIDMARCFFNDDGSLRTPLKRAIGDEERIRAASRGGVFHLGEVYVQRDFRGRDLALEFVASVLQLLDGRWSLVVSNIVPWDYEDWQRGQRREEYARTDEEYAHLCRHFARLGFAQVGYWYWYLERSQQPLHLLTREAVASLKVHHKAKPLKPPQLSELDKQLVSLVATLTMKNRVPTDASVVAREIGKLLLAGASISSSNALHFAVGGCKYDDQWSPLALQILMAEGATVDTADYQGHTALHVAASECSERAVRHLLEYRADPLARDLGGNTPRDVHTRSTTNELQSMMDFEACNRPQWDAIGIPAPACSPAAEAAKRHLPCAQLLLRAEAACMAECLVKCLMYCSAFTPDLLRKIHGLVEPPRLAIGSKVILGALENTELNGCAATVLGWDAASSQYVLQQADESLTAIKVGPEHVLPQRMHVQASAQGGDEEFDESSDDEFDGDDDNEFEDDDDSDDENVEFDYDAYGEEDSGEEETQEE
mmetsp:Transcript_51842/g.119189  ORF Transcript_51842/g.119189 Transcript_51842/m.119189 type:complete len:587 (-) Transcript_51842:162-1922(-)|eukprot:CAMPEP_0119376316 /NCGR_PEP_ID=MMETSP1334-20130426/40006_1 /TAXON_ID=127549 /ORGANISM="Calcidiscus leptoporus, Strain RCC1130" /LENGTH=586 /DNA_ID=CAMNT_0007394867 /DNA_START=188 /DNA_END=1948 /DNA_ORIENTATION=-